MGLKFNPLTGQLDLVNKSGGMSIGGAVTSGTSKSVLFVDGSGNLAQDNANLAWDNVSKQLKIGTSGLFTSNGSLLTPLITEPSGNGPYIQFQGGNMNVVSQSAAQIPFIVIAAAAQSGDLQRWVDANSAIAGKFNSAGKLGLQMGASSLSAYLHIGGGTATAGTAPLKFTAGINLGTPENGTWEYDGTDFFYTTGGTRHTLSSGGGGGMSIGGAVSSSTGGSALYVDGSGNLAQDNANFFWDATNHRLGLGTATPNQQLELTKNMRLVESTTVAGIIYQGTNLLLHTYAGTAGVVNTFLGVGAGNLTNTSGGGSGRNVGIGKNAMHALADGYQNTVVGELAGSAITDGYSNTLIGYQTGWLITTGFGNTGIGTQALTAVTTGADNNAFGYKALGALTSGASNLGFGYNSNPTVTSGNENIGIGDNAMNGLTTGNNNTVVGAESLKGGNVSDNTVVGYFAMNRVTTASHNTAIGMETFYAMTTGLYNTALGWVAGSYIDDVTTGQNNTFLGAKTSFPNSTQHNYATAIGADAVVAASNAMVFGGPDTGGAEINAGVGITAPLARLHLPPGRAAATKAPLMFTAGTNLTTPVNGAMEFDGTHLYITISGSRLTII